MERRLRRALHPACILKPPHHPGMLAFRWISAAATLPLRSQLLRDGAPEAECQFEEDQLSGARHAGALLQDRLVGVLSLYPVALPSLPGSWQLRGMAVEPKCQGIGVGRQLLSFAQREMEAAAIAPSLWCNARTSAVRFYQNNGWEVISPPFEIPGVGPHVRMRRTLD